MSAPYYPRLSNLVDFAQLPDQLQGLQDDDHDLLAATFYQNFNLDVSPGTWQVSLELVLLRVFRFELADSGFALIINPSPADPFATSIPITVRGELGILRYVDEFDTALLAGGVSAYYSLLLAVAGVPDQTLLKGAVTYLGTNGMITLHDFALAANQRYAGLGLTIPATGPVNDADLDLLVAEFSSRTGGTMPTLTQAIYDLYLAASTSEQTQYQMAQLFTLWLGNDPFGQVDKLIRPEITASTYLSVAVEVPQSLLLRVRKVTASNGAITYEPDTSGNAQLFFQSGDFFYSTQGGFGYQGPVGVSLPADYPRLQLGKTGLQLDFTEAKVDLSGRRELAEAVAEGRPANFSGIYIDSANLYLPSDWHLASGSSPTLGARQVLVGTGGISGTFLATGTGTGAHLFEVTLFQDLKISFDSFELTLRQNEVINSGITGIFTLAAAKGANGQPIPFGFSLAFGEQGYELAFEAPIVNGQPVPVVARLGTIGEVRFTRLAIGRVDNDWYLDVAAEVVLTGSLPIVGKVLPKQINIKRLLLSTDSSKTALAVQPIWPDGTSVSGDLDTGLLITKTLNLVILDAIKVDLMRLAIARNQTTHTVSALATFDAALKLGTDSEFSTQPGSGQKPRGFLLQVQNIGFYVETEFKSGGGDVGPAELDVRFKLPDGVLVSVNAGGIVGGGSLAILENGNRYEGSIGLTFQDKINLGAFVILLKNLPNGQEGPSLLALISVSFQSNPIQLGLGFKLEGVGGLIGLHRTASIPVLRAGVSNGSLANLLFPANPAQDAALILRTMDQAFPPAANRYTFGLMGKIAWGTPTLVTLDIGLIIEVPAPVRFILLGVLRAMLPNASNPIIRLRADFLGVIDFGAKKISFDAQLVDSKVLQFALSGNFAFRLYQGDDPVFLMTAGGFHPSFRPPANADLPTLQRLMLALAQGGDFRLTLTSYLAITTNTVQFGSKLELYVNIGAGFSLQGFLSFDALFRFNPFYLEVRIGAGVAIKKGSRSMLSISLNLLVSGPAPWHVDGEGSFKILFFKIKFRVNRTFGGGASQPALPSTDVRQLLMAALADASNWEVEPRAIQPANTVVLRTDDNSSELVVDPGGVLAVHQRVVPLGYPIEVYGNTRPVNGNEFTITEVTMGSTAPLYHPGAGDLGEIREAFAPGQFRRMSDGEKLSAPSFQLMRSGLRIKSVDGLDGKEGVSRQFVFEMKIFAPAPAIAAGVSNTSFARLTTGTTSATSSDDSSNWVSNSLTVTQNFATGKLQRLAKMGAVGRTRRSYEQRRPSRTAPDQVLWSEDSYAIVSTRDLQPEEAAPNPFRTEAEATAYLQRLQAEDPSRVGELQVVPVYQLDVSAPSSIFNTATA